MYEYKINVNTIINHLCLRKGYGSNYYVTYQMYYIIDLLKCIDIFNKPIF